MINKLIKLFGFLLLLSCIIASWYWMEYNTFLESKIKITKATTFSIKSGSSLSTISNQLAHQEIIEHPQYFKWFVKLAKQDNKIQAGEYILQAGYKPDDLMRVFVSGAVSQYQLTIPEGWTLKQVLAYLPSTDLIKSKLDDFELRVKFDDKSYSAEGFIFPETYFFPQNTSDISFIKRSINQMKQVLNQEWEKREKGLPLKNPYEALILASIVERESGKKSERSKIAGVFIRRLNKGMRLQSDPTIIYGMGERYKGNIRRKDINEKTAYNTYQIKALPPTPIASPGRDAIHAVLHPDKGKSLYFVADGSGGHYFSNTLKQHNNAVRKYILKK